MANDIEKQLREELEHKQRQIDMLRAIDRIRDVGPPSAMLTTIVNVLSNAFSTDLCLISILNPESGELELKAVKDRGEQFGQLGPAIVEKLAEQIVMTDAVTIWEGGKTLARLGLKKPPEGLQLVVCPIVMEAEKRTLGAILLGRAGAPFIQRDVELLETAESQIDSAVVQAYAQHELGQRQRELETIYRVDRIRDEKIPFDEMLNKVLKELCTVIEAEMGFIMLYDRVGKQLEMRAATNEDLFKMSPHYDIVSRVANEALRETRLVCHNDLGGELRSVMGIPLILGDEIIGVFGVGNRLGGAGFWEEDRRLLSAIASQMDTAIFESLEIRRLRQVLGRSVDPNVMERLLENPDVGFLKGERTVMSVLYADIRGSTSLAERVEPELLVGFINAYLSRMVDVILAHEGTLDKFVGDEVMALFGAPMTQPDHALRATRVGLALQEAYRDVVAEWGSKGIGDVPLGVGIATGEVIVGEMGSIHRTDYTVIGRTANLGARICAVAAPGQVLVSQATYDLVREKVEANPIPGQKFKGIGHEVTVYHVTRVKE
jgi:adenylate cyclase